MSTQPDSPREYTKDEVAALSDAEIRAYFAANGLDIITKGGDHILFSLASPRGQPASWRAPLGVPAANLTADHPPARAVCCLSPRCERAWSPSFRRFVAGRAPHLPPPRLESSRNTRSGALAPAGQQLVPALGTHTQREREPGHAPASLLAQRCRDLATAIELGSALWAGRIKLCLEERTGSSPPIPP